MPSAIGMARGMVRAGSRTSSPSVAIRAYPANAKNSNPAACSTPRDADVVAERQPCAVDVAEAEEDDHHRGEHRQHRATMARVSIADFWMPA